ncbi:DUF6531 domain-containing protein [Myxococcus faecalis]|uniref:DUF6531 domain-containing protein n=1 Tax=Myxococcus faecalis TaxID=3115646 RepID=UPI0038D1A979
MSASGRVSVGHPVDVASGVLFNTWLDFAIPGTLPLVFERFYSTALITQTAEAPLGPGWRHGFQHELRLTLEGFAYLDPQGVEHPLEDSKGSFDTCGKLLSPAHQMELRGTRDDLELQHYGGPHPQWVLHFRRRPKSTRYRLESLGLSPQARLRFEYSSTGPLKRVIHARSGRALRLESTPQGRLVAVWFEGPPKELVARYTYDARGNLIQVTDRIGVVADYGYDAHHRMLSEAKATGAVYTFRHDAQGRCIQASGTDRFEERLLRYDPARRVTDVSDSHGERTRYEYNEAGQVTSLLTPLGTRAAYTFDDLGRLVAITDVNGNRSTLRYDEAGHPCAASYPDGRELCIEYDDRHRPVKFTDHSGKSWRYAHDAWGAWCTPSTRWAMNGTTNTTPRASWCASSTRSAR